MSIFGVRKYSGATERFVISNINKIKTELDNATQVYKMVLDNKISNLQSTDVLFYKYKGDGLRNIKIVKQGQREITQIYSSTLNSFIPFNEEGYLSLFSDKIQDMGKKLKISSDKTSVIANEDCLIELSFYLDLHVEKVENKEHGLKFFIKTNRLRTDSEIACIVYVDENQSYNINLDGALYLNKGDSLKLACISPPGDITFNFTSNSRFIIFLN